MRPIIQIFLSFYLLFRYTSHMRWKKMRPPNIFWINIHACTLYQKRQGQISYYIVEITDFYISTCFLHKVVVRGHNQPTMHVARKKRKCTSSMMRCIHARDVSKEAKSFMYVKYKEWISQAPLGPQNRDGTERILACEPLNGRSCFIGKC